MEDIKIRELTPGRNLKNIRKSLGLRQQEIVGDEITRNLISMIEHEKSPLSYRVAKLIAENINTISKERDMGVYIHPEDIMNPKRMEVKGIADEYIEELEEYKKSKNYDLDESYVKEIEEFLNKWKIPEKKVVIYELIGDIYYHNKNFRYEYLYLNRALENYFVNPVRQDIYVLVRKLMANCINTKRYSEAIRLSNLNIMQSERITREFKVKLCFNKALAYKNLGYVDEALNILEELKQHYSEDFNRLVRPLILEAICYRAKGQVDDAISNYLKIIDQCGTTCEELGLVYINLVDLYMGKGLKDKVIEYRDKAIGVVSDIPRDHKYLVKIYYWIGKGNEYLEDIEFAEYYYVSSLDAAMKRKDNEERSLALLALTKLYERTNQIDKIFASDSIFKKCFKDIEMTNDIQLALGLISINMKAGRNDKVNDVINYLLKEV